MRVEELIVLTADLLTDLIEQEESACESPFNSQAAPPISLADFLRRLHRYTHFSPECLVIAIIYIDRYNMGQPLFSLSPLNAHKLLLAALLVAAKFQDDFYYDNRAFEFAGGVNAAHLLQLELELFSALEYSLFVSQQEFEELEDKLYEVYGEGGSDSD